MGWTGLSILSRWTHGFESRWGCQRSPVRRHSQECLFWFSPLANLVPIYFDRRLPMKGFIRLRGDAFELRVFFGADTLTDRRVAQAPLVRVRGCSDNLCCLWC